MDQENNLQSSKEELTDKQKRFCEQYVIDFNGKQAAIRVGYSKKTAEPQASRMLRKVKVREYIRKLTQSFAAKSEIDKDMLLNDLIQIKQRCMSAVPVMEYNREEKTYTQLVNEDGNHVWTFDASNAVKAIAQASKMLGFDAPIKNDNTNINLDLPLNADEQEALRAALEEIGSKEDSI